MASKKHQTASDSSLTTIMQVTRRTAVLGLLAGVIAAMYALTMDNQYAAQSGLLLAPLPLGQAVWNRDQQTVEDNPATQIGFLMGRPLSVRGYEILLRNDEIVKQLRDKLVAISKERGEDTAISLEDVRSAMTLRTEILKQTAYDVEYVPLLTLSYRASDPEFAAALANEWARLAIELSGDVSAKGKSGSAEFLQGRLEQVNEQLETVEASIQEHETQWDIEAMTLRAQEMQKVITEYELDQVRLNTDIESARAELEAVAKDLESTSEKTTLRKAPSDEAYWLMEATGKGNPDSKDVLESEVVSEVFVILREHKTTLDSKIAGLASRQEAGAAALQQLQEELGTLQRDLAEQKRERAKLERRKDVSEQQFARIAENLEAARVAEAETEPDLKVVFNAVPPETKIGPHRSVMVLTAMFLGALVAPIQFFVLLSLRRFAAFLDSSAPETTGTPE